MTAPTPALVEALGGVTGDLMVLGVGGKMGVGGTAGVAVGSTGVSVACAAMTGSPAGKGVFVGVAVAACSAGPQPARSNRLQTSRKTGKIGKRAESRERVPTT